MVDIDQQGEFLYEIITDLNHTDFVYLLADLCSVQGWEPMIALGNKKYVGDLVVRQVLPEPRAIELLYYDSGQLSEGDLQDLVSNIESEHLTIVTREEPAFSVSETEVGIIGLGDVVGEILNTGAFGVIEPYISENSDEERRYKQMFARARQTPVDSNEEGSEHADEEGDNHIEPAEQEQFEESSSGLRLDINEEGYASEGRFIGMELLGWQFVNARNETGLVTAIRIGSKDFDIVVQPECFTLHDQSGFTYQSARKKYDSPIGKEIASRLSSPWKMFESEVSAGGLINYVLYFPVETDIKLEKIRYKSNYKELLTIHREQIREEIDENRRAETAKEVFMPENSADFNLPETITDHLQEITRHNFASDAESYLPDGVVGIENDVIAVEIEAWDFYHSADNQGSDNLQDGVFVSIEVTPREDELGFRSGYLSIEDTDGYRYTANGDSNALRHMEYDNLLNQPWVWEFEGRVSLPPMGKRVKMLQHIPCSSPIEAAKILVKGRDNDSELVLEEGVWKDLRGLPETLDQALSQYSYERTK
jgi:hypothetical protein